MENKLQNLEKFRIIETPPFTIPGQGGITVEFGCTFSKTLTCIAVPVFQQNSNGNINPIVVSYTTHSAFVDYVDWQVTGQAKLIVFGII